MIKYFSRKSKVLIWSINTFSEIRDWEISIRLNVTSFSRDDEKSDFHPCKWRGQLIHNINMIITDWWNDSYLLLAFVHGGTTQNSLTQLWKWLHGVLEQKNFQWGLRSIMSGRLLLWGNLVLLWVDNINWPLFRFQKLMFQVLALCERETFLCHSLWQRANAENVIFWNWNSGQFIYIINSVDNTNLPSHVLPPTQHHSFFRDLAPYLFNRTFYL